MATSSSQKKKWSWKFPNTSDSVQKKRRHSNLNCQIIDEFNNQNKIYPNVA